jgi:hypothetical protein
VCSSYIPYMKQLTPSGNFISLTSRILRVAVLAVGPFTNCFLLIKNISTPLFGVEKAITAYTSGVVMMCIIHLTLIKHRNKTLDSTVNTITNRSMQSMALTVTSMAYLSNTTAQILHITGMRQMFLVSFGLTALRIQQTLSGGKASALFSGPISLIAFLVLVVIWARTEIDDETFRYPEPRTHMLEQIPAFIACIFIGAAAQVHILWVMFNQQPDIPYDKPPEWFAVCTAVVHVVLICISGLMQKAHPFTIDALTVQLNPSVYLLMFRLITSITLLLLCTAPIMNSGVFRSIFMDGSVIIATVLIISTHPHIGTAAIIGFSAVKVVLVFCLLYLVTDNWIPKSILDHLRSIKSN